jgi:two-component sensor histidine kinase
MPVARKSFLTPLVLAAGFLLLGLSDGAVWLFKAGSSQIGHVLRWEALDRSIGYVVSVLLFLIYGRIEKRLRGARLVLAVAALCYGFGVLWRFLSGLMQWDCGMTATFTPSVGVLAIRGGLWDGTTLGLFSFVGFAIEHWRDAAEQREKARQAAALAQKAQLQMLRYQLNPHFLFNALNSIRAMIAEDPERSRSMVTELAEFLRYSLDGKEQTSAIGDEIQAITNYLAIQRIRFEDKLDATLRVDQSALKAAVPCFLIHPLVENAIKYGMQTSKMPLRVRIEVTRKDREIAILVSNSGHWWDQPDTAAVGCLRDGTGTGLKNIRDRLKLVFPDRHSFRIWEDEGWVRSEIRIQLTSEEIHYETAHSPDRG